MAINKVLHAHVPKTAGTSLNSWLDDSVSFERAKPGDFDGLLARWFREHGVAGDRSLHANCLSCWDLFDVLHGHRNMIPERPPGSVIITVFRDPIKRTISQHYDLASLTAEHLTHISVQPVMDFHNDCMTMSFAEIRKKWGDQYQFKTRYVDYICRIFLCRHIRLRPFLDMEPKERFERAVKIVEDASIHVGLTEHIGKSVHRFSKALGLYPIHSLPKYNIGRPARTEMTSEDTDHIRAITVGDQMLYEYFRNKFEQLNVSYTVEDFERDNLKAAVQRVQVTAAKGWSTYGVNAAFIGEGFWGRDGGGSPECCRWSGPGDESVLYIPVQASVEVDVELRIVGWMSAGSRSAFKVSVWGEPVEHSFAWIAGRGYADIARLRAKPRDGVLKFAFRCPAKTDEECGHSQSDGRRKGFALREIGVKPA